jgi:hypothetical protein
MFYDSINFFLLPVLFPFSAVHLSISSHRMSVAAAQENIDIEMDRQIKYLLPSNKTLERTKAVLTRRSEADRRMRDERARSRSPTSRSRSPKSRPPTGRGRAPPSTGPDSYVQRIPFLSRTTRFAILCSERNIFKARGEADLKYISGRINLDVQVPLD